MSNIHLLTNKRIDVSVTTFPAGEVNVFVPFCRGDKIGIRAMIRDSKDVMTLLLTVDAVKRRCEYDELYLVMPYIPYARQDRVCNEGEAFSLKVFANLINSCEFDKVIVTDPHSDVAPALIDNCVIEEQWENILYLKDTDSLFEEILSKSDVVSPDAGAEKKTTKLCQKIGKEYFHRGIKHRDLSTGRLSGFDVQFNNPYGKIPESVLIVDDICDGGGTFIGLANVLKERGVKRVYLYVTHGIYSKGKNYLLNKGVDALFQKFDWTGGIS